MLQYKIPQNVGIEDKIVGPFSLRQLIIVAIGGGSSYVLFAISSKIYELNALEYLLIALPALFSLALAMLRIHNVSFGKYLLLMIEFAIKPKKRIWNHRGISALVAPDLTEKSRKQQSNVKKESERKDVNLRDLSAMLDSGGFEHIQPVKHEDIDDVNDDDLITEAYFGHKQKSKSDNMYWRTREVQKKKLDLLAKIKSAPPKKTIEETKTKKEVEKTPTESNAAEKKKESVVQQLAKVIKEARKNNQAIIQKVVPPTAPSPKKRRRKRRKPKNDALPVRQNTQINTLDKSGPNKTITNEIKTEGEASFEDLSKGGEIEINLD